MLKQRCVFLLCVVTFASARTTNYAATNAIDNANKPVTEMEATLARGAASFAENYLGDLKMFYRVYQECSSKDLSSCLKLKLIAAMDRAARSFKDFSVVDGVTFVQEVNVPSAEPVKNESELEATLPRGLEAREDALNDMIMDKVMNFFQTHTLQVKLPSTDSLTEERGKKDKKGMGALMMTGMLMAGTMIPMAMGSLAMLAGKAFIVAKLALVLAGIIGLKKLFSSGGGGDYGHVEVVSANGHGGGWGRSLTETTGAQNIAYRAHAQYKNQS